MNKNTPLRRAMLRRKLTTYAIEAVGWAVSLGAFSRMAPRFPIEPAVLHFLVWGLVLLLTRTCVVVFLRDRLGLMSEEERWRQELQR